MPGERMSVLKCLMAKVKAGLVTADLAQPLIETISRLEKRSDMLLSTLRHYVEGMGGRLELVAQFPDRPPMVIDHLGMDPSLARKTVAGSRKARLSA